MITDHHGPLIRKYSHTISLTVSRYVILGRPCIRIVLAQHLFNLFGQQGLFRQMLLIFLELLKIENPAAVASMLYNFLSDDILMLGDSYRLLRIASAAFSHLDDCRVVYRHDARGLSMDPG